VEYIRKTLPNGEELVLLDENEAAAFGYGPDPRRTSLRLRRDALAARPSLPTKPPSTSTGH
jgi:hypothetical protein